MRNIYACGILSLVILFSCKRDVVKIEEVNQNTSDIICSTADCQGSYIGPEFVKGADIAHQFSNTMSRVVGDKLKEFYTKQDYKKVDFTKIEMTTSGMGSGSVTYFLKIPFLSVSHKCDAYTSFDHVGGWNHSPELFRRKQALQKALMPGHDLDISDLKQTAEGLQEYWIQWKNIEVQSDCK